MNALILALHLDPTWMGPTAQLSCHQEAMGHFLSRHYFEAHESWETLWKAQQPESTGRHAFQALIRLCAAGVKRQKSNIPGYFHHLRGALAHLVSMETTLVLDQELPHDWKELAIWLRLHSQAEGKLEK